MIHAYPDNYLSKAKTTLASYLDYAVNDCGYSLKKVWDTFVNSSIGKRFETGDPFIILGRSGVELAMELFNEDKERQFRIEKTPEYWLGYSLTYYQWYYNISFKDITVPIDDLLMLYHPYHEMDVRQFCDKVDSLMGIDRSISNLKKMRQSTGISQKELSLLSGVPLRTIQQYEQRQKDINGARGEYLIRLAKALNVNPASLLE